MRVAAVPCLTRNTECTPPSRRCPTDSSTPGGCVTASAASAARRRRRPPAGAHGPLRGDHGRWRCCPAPNSAPNPAPNPNPNPYPYPDPDPNQNPNPDQVALLSLPHAREEREGKSCRNRAEAEAVVRLVLDLLRAVVAVGPRGGGKGKGVPHEIGVITPYKAQARLLPSLRSILTVAILTRSCTRCGSTHCGPTYHGRRGYCSPCSQRRTAPPRARVWTVTRTRPSRRRCASRCARSRWARRP